MNKIIQQTSDAIAMVSTHHPKVNYNYRMVTKVKVRKLSPRVAKFANEVTRRILETVQPQRVLLFGSSVRGAFSKDSDLDILVIVQGPVHRRQLAQKIYSNLHGVGVPVDIVVATEEDVAQYGNKPGSILRPALMEGQVLYARPPRQLENVLVGSPSPRASQPTLNAKALGVLVEDIVK